MTQATISGDDFTILDVSAVQAFVLAHPAATNVLMGGVWVQVNMPYAAFAELVAAARQSTRSVGFQP